MTPNELATLLNNNVSPPEAAEIQAFETLIDMRLPEDYRAFLALTRGGRPSAHVVFSLDGEEIGSEYLRRVAGLNPDPDVSLEERHRMATACDIPEGLLSIMSDAGGNHIAIALRPDRFGEIFFLDHEVSGGEGRPSLEEAEGENWGYAIRFASSFSEMVAGFEIDRP